MLMVRSHNEGSLFQRRKGRDQGVWVAAVTMRDGRRASRTAHSRDDAKAQLAELLRLRDAGARDTGRVRLGDYLERWVSRDHGWAPATRRKHETAVRVHLIPRLGHIRLSELRTADVSEALADYLASGLGAQSVRHLRATLRRGLADAVRDGLVSRNVGGLAQPPGLPHRERSVLSADDARRLIDSTHGTRYGPLWTILVTTGLRISEALGLAWSDVELGGNDASRRDDRAVDHSDGHPVRDRQAAVRQPLDDRRGASLTVRHALQRVAGEWQLRPPKTAKGRRQIPLTPLGVEALRVQRAMQRADMAKFYGGDDARPSAGGAGLRVWDDRDGAADRSGGHAVVGRADRGRRSSVPDVGFGAPRSPVTPIDGLVFTTSVGHPIHATNLLPKLRADLAAAGLPRVTIHDLRHSAATVLYAQGIPLETIADMLGHSTPRITAELYRHKVPELQQEAADAMQRALG